MFGLFEVLEMCDSEAQALQSGELKQFQRVLFLVIGLFAAGSAAAQETTGRIQGRILDQQALPMPGVAVVATGPQGATEVTTDADGRFNIPFLTPGAYGVRAQLEGFKALERSDLNVSLGQTIDLRLTIEIGGFSETVTVVGAVAPIDPGSTTTGAVIDGDFARSVPVGRRISDVTYMAPGVSNSGSIGRQNPSIGGSSGLDNQYVIDGVNITNQGYGALGSYSIFHGSLGNATPFDFVKEVQVKTGGYEAEFGQSTGGVVNVVTKSGSNALHGSSFAYARPKQLEGTWRRYQSENGTVQTLSSQMHDAGVEGGGPIITSRLFFFGAIDWQRETSTFQAPDGFPLSTTEGYDRTRRNISYASKGTLQVGGGGRMDVSVFGDPSHGPMGPQRPSSLTVSSTASFSEIDYGGHNQTVRYDGVLGGNWLVEAAYARALNRISEVPATNEWRVTDTTASPMRVTGGVGFYEAGNRSLDSQWAIKSTNIVGPHQIKYGFAYDDVTYSNRNQNTGPTITAPDGRQTETGARVSILADPALGNIYRVTRSSFNSGIETTQTYFNFFVQDSWKVGSRLTLNPGLRYEQETLSGTIVKDFELKNNWAPRIGAAYTATSDRKTKVFGGWGRFFARLPNDVAVKALSGVEQIGRADYFDAALTRPIPNGTLAGGVTSHYSILSANAGSAADPDAKLSYVDELVIGVERETWANTSLSVRYVYRNIGRVLEDLGSVPMVAFDLGLADDVETIVTNPSRKSPILPAAQSLGAGFDDPVHKYHAIEVALDRRFANNWSAMTSYRWSRLRGNFDGFYRDDNGQSDPGWTSLYDFPTNDPSYTAIGGPEFGYEGDIRYLGQSGILPLDRPHQVKVFGNYAWDNGLSVGLGLNLGSGKPLTPLAANAWYASGGEIPVAPRGSGIQTIDGFRKRTPFESQVDLQVSYVLKTGARSLTLLADIFNVFNERRTQDYDTWTQLASLEPNPDFGKPISQIPGAYGPQFQAPIQVRVGARFSF
ncbi:MAG: TonB-dependent receptor [Vicinamibacterales bacterium]